MNCIEFDKLIVRLACDTLASGSLREQALAHAAACQQCGARLAQQQLVAEGLDALAIHERNIQAPAHLGAALLAEFERQQTLAAPQHVSSEPIRFRLVSLLNWRWATTIAAVLVVAGLTAVLWRQPIRQTSPVQKEIATTVTPTPVNTPVNNETNMAATVAPKPKRRKSARYKTDEYGALISLMPIAPTETEEFQQVVSMQIPRSTLRLWGLPLNEESDSEQVRAKVYFSEDGVARAIRLRN
ncbi:MAG: hypothetical protein JNK38_27050 [Acidobacteria bacterium]|nr:hypothetical protein [Acidobacteriota bacterium]